MSTVMAGDAAAGGRWRQWHASPLPWACLLLLALPLSPSGFAVVGALVLLGWRTAVLPPPAVAVTTAAAGRMSSLLPVALLLAATCLLGIAFSFDPRRSLQTVAKLLPGLLLVYAWLRYAHRDGRIDGAALAPALALGVAVATAAFIVSQLYFGGYLVSSPGIVPLFTRNSVSVALLVTLAAALALWLQDRRRAWFVVALLLLWLLVANSARGGLLAGLAIAAYAVFRAMGLNHRQMLVAGLVLLIAGGALVYAFHDQLAAARRGSLLTGRDFLWRGALQVFEDYPLAGIGINTWKYSAYVDALVFPWVKEAGPHNIVLDVLVSVGIMGGLLLAAALALFARALARLPVAVAPVLQDFGLLLLLAMIANGMVDFRVFSAQFVALVGVGMVFALTGRSTGRMALK